MKSSILTNAQVLKCLEVFRIVKMDAKKNIASVIAIANLTKKKTAETKAG